VRGSVYCTASFSVFSRRRAKLPIITPTFGSTTNLQHFQIGTVIQQTSNTVATGKVISQEPTSGSSMAQDSPVNLVISSGPQVVTVPNVERLTQDEATTAVTAAKLTMGTVTQQASNTVATGNVISQDPGNGTPPGRTHNTSLDRTRRVE
jgi:beta-lactam-binding protein with PASTA domain